MTEIFSRFIKEKFASWLALCLIVVILLWMYVWIFPTMQTQSQALSEMMKTFPKEFLKAFNFDMNAMTKLEGFIASENFGVFWPIIMAIMAMNYAASIIASELESRVIELTLSLPVSRVKIFLSRVSASMMLLISFDLVSVLGVIPLAKIYNISINATNLYIFAILAILFSFSLFGMAMLASSIFSSKGKVYLVTLVVFLGSYVLNIISSLSKDLEPLKNISLFYYYKINPAILEGSLSSDSIIVFSSIFCICFISSVLIFFKRDV